MRGYYHDKTAAIIDRYGPGPRVHYHIGLFRDSDSPGDGSADQLRATIVAAQERLLEYAAGVWDADKVFAGDLLDVGCGLGGGAIYWAQHFPVRVTAVTNVASHAGVIAGFSAAAGVRQRVLPVVSDVVNLNMTGRYSAAVAIESSCYIPRPQLFGQVAAALRPGGVFGIEDVFLGAPEWRAMHDEYWKTSIGSVDQYAQAAAQAGMLLEYDADVTEQATAFWRFSMAWAQARLAGPAASGDERQRLLRSIRWHARFLQGWQAGAFQTHILRFRKLG